MWQGSWDLLMEGETPGGATLSLFEGSRSHLLGLISALRPRGQEHRSGEGEQEGTTHSPTLLQQGRGLPYSSPLPKGAGLPSSPGHSLTPPFQNTTSKKLQIYSTKLSFHCYLG